MDFEIPTSISQSNPLVNSQLAANSESNLTISENEFASLFEELMPKFPEFKSTSEESDRSLDVVYPLLPNLWLIAKKVSANSPNNNDKEKRRQQHKKK